MIYPQMLEKIDAHSEAIERVAQFNRTFCHRILNQENKRIKDAQFTGYMAIIKQLAGENKFQKSELKHNYYIVKKYPLKNHTILQKALDIYGVEKIAGAL